MTSGFQVPFVDFSAQHEGIRDEILSRFSKIIDESSFTLGGEVKEFEKQFAAFCGVRHAVGVANGTDALVLALRALDVGPGDEVITSANTFVATAEAIAHTGAIPVLADIVPDTYCIDVECIERALSPRTKAIIPVHLYGCPADMGPIMDLAKANKLAVVADAAQAHGASYHSLPVGSLGDAAIFSFYPSKNLGAFGDGGAVVTDRDEIAARVFELRDHGSLRKYEHKVIGYTSRLHSLQAAVLNVKLPFVDQWNRMRQNSAQVYESLLADLPGIVLPTAGHEVIHVFHLYVVRIEVAERDAVSDYLASKGIATGIHYPQPVHLTEAFQYLRYRPGSFPVAEEYAGQILSLPMFPSLDPGKIGYIARKLTEFLLS